jgi:hypothetical protein
MNELKKKATNVNRQGIKSRENGMTFKQKNTKRILASDKF